MKVLRTLTNWLALPAMILTPALALCLAPQSGGTLRGQVTDPSGAAVTQVTVIATGAGGETRGAQVGKDGTYQIQGLTPGNYKVSALAKGFAPFEQPNVTVTAGQSQKFDIQLKLQEQMQQVNVNGEAPALSVAPENNVSSVVISGKELDALSDDPDELQTELQALAGPAAGPSGGQIYIDGFTGGQLPPKEAILEVRINQNPFSAEYDKLGYGRIEITTKPGFSQFHGNFMADGNDSSFNARSPFAVTEPPYHTDFYNGTIGGPISKKASFFLDGFRRDIEDNSVVSAVVLSPTFQQEPFSTVVINPLARTNISPRVDYQVSQNNVLTMRYQWWEDIEDNDGITQFSLPTQAYDTRETEDTVQISDTQVLSSRTVNQTRFQFLRENDLQNPVSTLPAVNILGAFTGGGNFQQKSLDLENHFELQNLTTMALGKHQVIFGGRWRDYEISNSTTQNFNGTYTFGTIAAYQQAEMALAGCTAPCPTGVPGATQFSITVGNPLAKINYFDMGLYGEDTWRVRPNISLSMGLRLESQNYISDHADFAPRVGLAWGLGKGRTPKTVLRAGSGIFYDRFQQTQILEAEHLNGINEQQYLVTNPAFFPYTTVPAGTTASLPSLYRIASGLRAPYTIQSAAGLERQLTKTMTASVTYINSHGLHQLLANNINAPYNFTSCPAGVTTDCGPLSGTYPLGVDAGYVYQFESAGLYNENQLVTNFNIRAGTRLTAFGFYTLSYGSANTSGASDVPMNPYDIDEDYGPAAFVSRNQAFVGGSLDLPKGFRLSPFMIAQTGRPYNITLGEDVYGTGVFNTRPAVAPAGAPNSISTIYGNFYLYGTTTQEPIAPYEFFAPGLVSLNMRLAKTFGFGKKPQKASGGNRGGYYGGGGPGGGRSGPGGGLGGRGLSGGGGPGMFGGGSENTKYSLEFSINARNIFNHINLGAPDGNVGSPLFGQSNNVNGFMGYRRIDLMVRFNF
jgi:Carboxypeptidase regulatory-like domain